MVAGRKFKQNRMIHYKTLENSDLSTKEEGMQCFVLFHPKCKCMKAVVNFECASKNNVDWPGMRLLFVKETSFCVFFNFDTCI